MKRASMPLLARCSLNPKPEILKTLVPGQKLLAFELNDRMKDCEEAQQFPTVSVRA